jgi:hypothetical protein
MSTSAAIHQIARLEALASEMLQQCCKARKMLERIDAPASHKGGAMLSASQQANLTTGRRRTILASTRNPKNKKPVR